MTKFKQFHDFLVSNGIVSEGRLVQLRRVLREAGLVSSGGQGYASKPLLVSDVTNVFLGLVTPAQLKQAPDVVALYRSATLHPSHSVNFNPWPFANVEPSCNLGEFLDCFFEGLLHDRKNPGQDWTNICFKFDIVDGAVGASAALWFDDSYLGHTAKFNAFNPRTLAEINEGNVSTINAWHAQGVYKYVEVRDELLRLLVNFTVDHMFPVEGEVS